MLFDTKKKHTRFIKKFNPPASTMTTTTNHGDLQQTEIFSSQLHCSLSPTSFEPEFSAFSPETETVSSVFDFSSQASPRPKYNSICDVYLKPSTLPLVAPPTPTTPPATSVFRIPDLSSSSPSRLVPKIEELTAGYVDKQRKLKRKATLARANRKTKKKKLSFLSTENETLTRALEKANAQVEKLTRELQVVKVEAQVEMPPLQLIVDDPPPSPPASTNLSELRAEFLQWLFSQPETFYSHSNSLWTSLLEDLQVSSSVATKWREMYMTSCQELKQNWKNSVVQLRDAWKNIEVSKQQLVQTKSDFLCQFDDIRTSIRMTLGDDYNITLDDFVAKYAVLCLKINYEGMIKT